MILAALLIACHVVHTVLGVPTEAGEQVIIAWYQAKQ